MSTKPSRPRPLAGLWLSYIQSELCLGPESAAGVTMLYWRAKRELERGLVEEFTAQYSLLLQQRQNRATQALASSEGNTRAE